MVVLRLAGHVAIDVALLLEPAGSPGTDECLEGAEDGRSTDVGLAPSETLVELLRAHLAPGGRQRLRHQQPLTRHALTGRREPLGGGRCVEGPGHRPTLAHPLGSLGSLGETRYHRLMAGAATPASAPGLLSLRGVSADYGGEPVLREVDLEIPRGRLVSIIGPNGSGKSTLLKAILGLVPRVSGRVLLDGRPVARVRRRVAYVPQREAVDWSFPINAEQVAMMGRFPSIGWLLPPSREDRRAVLEALERVGMGDLRHRQIGSLSGGQQQRVFLARALVQGAAVLLLDEPLNGVDATTERVIVELMRNLRDSGVSIVQATHDLESAADTSDLLCFVNHRLVAFGPPEQTFTAHTLHETFGGEVLVLDAGDHAHVHAGGHHGAHSHVHDH